MTFAKVGCHSTGPGCSCVPPITREMGRMTIEHEKSNMEDNSNGINDNRTNQNNEEHTDQSSEDAKMILQSDELPLNHNIVIEKCDIFEDGLCHVCSKKLGTGSAVRVNDSQNRDIEFAPECSV